jgi:CHAT domain-containing protein
MATSLPMPLLVRGEAPKELTKQQQEQLIERERLLTEANRLYRAGKLAEAIAAAEQGLERERQAFGAVREASVGWLEWLAGQHEQREDYTAARKARQEVLALRIQRFGERDWRVIDARLALADGERTRAMTPPQRQQQAKSARLQDQVVTLFRQGRYAEAVNLARQVADLRKQVLGEKHPRYAVSLNDLARLYSTLGDYARAEPLYRQALALRKQALGEKHPDYAQSLNNLGLLYSSQGDYVKAEPLYRQATEIIKQAQGEKHITYATILNNLALLHQAQGDYAKAEPLFRQVSKVFKQVLGEKHPDYATSLNNLALLYQSQGDYAKAEPLSRQATEIIKQALGEKHPDYANGLTSLAELYRVEGDYAKAEPLLRQASEIYKQALGDKHPSLAVSLNGLGLLYFTLGDYAKAEPLLRQAMAIRKRALGEKHPEYAQSLNNLAGVYENQEDYAKAEPLVRQAMEIWKQALGEKHPQYAYSLNNLAWLYYSQGDSAKAEPLYREAAEIFKQAWGEKHLDYANCQYNLAMLYSSQGNYAKAERLGRQSLAICRHVLELSAAAQSQRQQLAMLKTLRIYLDFYLSLATEAKQPAERLYEYILAWKGAVGQRQRRQRLARRQPELAADFAALDRVSSQLAALALAVADSKRQEDIRKDIEKLTEDKERLEGLLARRSAAFRKEEELRRLSPAQLQAALPRDTVLVDFLEYTDDVPSEKRKGRKQQEGMLVAFVVRRDALVRVDLGRVQPIKAALNDWRLALQRRFRTTDDDDLGAAVRRLVWQPLEEHVREAKVVLIAPDGDLARVPFAALPGSKKGTYLLEETALAVVPVPQLLPELLTSRRADKDAPSLLLLGDVRYDSAAGSSEVNADSRAAARGSSDARMRWPALAHTHAEIQAIANTFAQRSDKGAVTQLHQAEATEAAVRQQAPTHRYLHFATHGYFAPKELRSALADVSRSQVANPSNLFGSTDVAGFHPGLLSGLVLAGANRPLDVDKDDGILTALEVEALNLTGVELATLSACETGLGEQAGGEGLLGLQRAFQVAGAHSVVAGLWQVDDAATRQLMVLFYDNLWRKKLPRLEALRQAQLWMLRQGDGWMRNEGISRGMIDVRVPKERLAKEDGRLPPYYWAAFSLSGDWR